MYILNGRNGGACDRRGFISEGAYLRRTLYPFTEFPALAGRRGGGRRGCSSACRFTKHATATVAWDYPGSGPTTARAPLTSSTSSVDDIAVTGDCVNLPGPV